MKLARILMFLLWGSWLAVPGVALAQTTRPQGSAATRPVGNQQIPPLMARQLEYILGILQSLDLTETQQQQVNDTLTQIREAIANVDRTSPDVQKEMRDIMSDLRTRITQILTPTQIRTFQEKVRENPGPLANADRRRDPPAIPPPPPSSPPSSPPMRESAKPDETPAPTDQVSGSSQTGRVAAPQIGQPAPELSAKRLDGNPVKLANYRAKPLVLIFGSYSVPSFRDKAPAISELERSYRNRATILVVYTAEAHPVGGWEVERNRDAKIAVQQHGNEADRTKAARMAKNILKLNNEFVIDTFNNATASAYAGTPNAAYIISKDGVLLAHQPWLEPQGLRSLIEEALRPAVPPSTQPSSSP